MLKIVVSFLTFILLFSSVSALETLSCEFRPGSCTADESLVFWAASDLSSHIRSNELSSGLYGNALCCSSPFGDLGFDTIAATDACPQGSAEMMYFTGETNARVALEYTPAHHTHKLCASLPDEFSNLDIEVSQEERKFEDAGYTCLYRMSNDTNSHVSSCNASYGSSETYLYTAWGRLFENLNTLSCNADCTSKLDGRVYFSCSAKVGACEDVPFECNGALLGSWVSSTETQEIKCEPNWDQTRSKVFTDEELDVESTSSECSNLISIKETVIIDNEPVVMSIYVCSD